MICHFADILDTEFLNLNTSFNCLSFAYWSNPSFLDVNMDLVKRAALRNLLGSVECTIVVSTVSNTKQNRINSIISKESWFNQVTKVSLSTSCLTLSFFAADFRTWFTIHESTLCNVTNKIIHCFQ